MIVHQDRSVTRRDFVASAGLGVGLKTAGRAPAQFPGEAELLNDGDEKTYLLVLDKGEEVMKGLLAFVKERGLTTGYFTAIGAVCQALVGFFDREKKDYLRITQKEQAEVLSLVGNLTLKNDQPFVHAHVVLGLPDGTTRGGHLFAATVWPTLELTFTASSKQVHRVADPETGLFLLQH
jgi:predicted DNA-binding protein with PD1-like motif